MFLCEFCKIFKNIFWQDTCWHWMTASCVYLGILRSCSDHYRVPLWNFLFQVQVAGFQSQDTGQCCIQMYFGTVWTVWAPKKNVFPYMFHVKPKWNIVYKYSEKIFFKRLKYPFPNALNKRYFWTPNCNYWGFGGIT